MNKQLYTVTYRDIIDGVDTVLPIAENINYSECLSLLDLAATCVFGGTFDIVKGSRQ